LTRRPPRVDGGGPIFSSVTEPACNPHAGLADLLGSVSACGGSVLLAPPTGCQSRRQLCKRGVICSIFCRNIPLCGLRSLVTQCKQFECCTPSNPHSGCGCSLHFQLCRPPPPLALCIADLQKNFSFAVSSTPLRMMSLPWAIFAGVGRDKQELTDAKSSVTMAEAWTLRLQCDLCGGGCRSVCTIRYELHETCDACDILGFMQPRAAVAVSQTTRRESS
jgi:hypothetical protein